MDTLPPKDKSCRFSGFTKSCRELVCSGQCTDAWVNIRGTHPQTGVEMDRFGCSYDWAYLLAMEAARVGTAAEAATLQLRNMIFNPDIRRRELTKGDEIKLIEGGSTDAHYDAGAR